MQIICINNTENELLCGQDKRIDFFAKESIWISREVFHGLAHACDAKAVDFFLPGKFPDPVPSI